MSNVDFRSGSGGSVGENSIKIRNLLLKDNITNRTARKKYLTTII